MANGNQLATLLGQGATMSPSGQTQIDLARSLAGSSIGGGPVRGGPIEALSRVGQAFFARRMMEEQQQEQSQRQERVQDTLSQALASRTGGQPGSGRQPSPQEISQVLMGTPETAPMGAQIALSRALQGEQPQRQTISGDQANQLFGTNLAPGAAVTVERGPQGMSVTGVENPASGGGDVRTLSPEQAMEAGFPEGSVVQQKANGEFTVKFEPGGRSGDQRDREISDLASDLQSQGVPNPRQKATRIVDGRARIEVSEDGQRAVFVDEVALAAGEENAVTELQLREPSDPERPEVEPADSLFGLAEKATGPQGTIRAFTARIPFTNVSESERGAVSARQAFDLTKNELARGMVINSKFPVKEREAVIEAINIDPSFFDNPDAMKARLSAARDFLKTKLAQSERDARDETLPEKTREDQAANASAIRNALDRIGQPAGELASTIRQISDLGSENAEFVVNDMPREQLREMINNASDEDLRSLPNEVSNMIRDRLRQ